MIKKLSYLLPLSFVIFSLLPAVSFAHPTNVLTGGYWGQAPNPIISCGAPIIVTPGPGITPTIRENLSGCRSLCDLIHTLMHIIAFGMSITLYVATPILFAWGGILILISAGNPSKISEGKKILTGTLIGLLIILSAYLIVKTFINTLGITDFIPGFSGSTFSCVVR